MCVSDKYVYLFCKDVDKLENCKSDGKGGNMVNQVYYFNLILKGMDCYLRGKGCLYYLYIILYDI